MKVRFDGKEYEQGSNEHVLALEAKLDSQLVEIKTAGATEKARADRLDGELTAERAAHDATKAELTAARDPKKFDSAVNARVDLLVKARAALGDSAKFDGKSDLEVMTEVVTLAYPKVSLDGKSVDYVAALFDRAIESGVRSDSIQRLPEVVRQVQDDAIRREDAAPATKPAPCTTHKWAMSKE